MPDCVCVTWNLSSYTDLTAVNYCSLCVISCSSCARYNKLHVLISLFAPHVTASIFRLCYLVHLACSDLSFGSTRYSLYLSTVPAVRVRIFWECILMYAIQSLVHISTVIVRAYLHTSIVVLTSTYTRYRYGVFVLLRCAPAFDKRPFNFRTLCSVFLPSFAIFSPFARSRKLNIVNCADGWQRDELISYFLKSAI